MLEHGIMFSEPMVLAIGAKRKHVTRRLDKSWLKVKAGDRIWVRETWGLGGDRLIDPVINYRAGGAQRPINRHKTDRALWYPAGSGQPITTEQLLKPSLLRKGWIPGIHMFRWASRYLLEVKEDAREERLQDITEEEAIAEGLLVQMGEGTGQGAGYKWNGPGYHDGVSFASNGGGMTFHVAVDGEFCCCHEGRKLQLTPARCAFRILWQSLHTEPGERWDDNPSLVRIGPFYDVSD
ncbi:MAG: Phage-related protein [Geminicoccaceae bacterium]|jgi:hypothetical protein|nr:Phage-related protein [Geminicoccaceae bacterium]